MSFTISYPYPLEKLKGEKADKLREEWSAIYTSHKIIEEKYTNLAREIEKESSELIKQAKANLKYLYSLEKRSVKQFWHKNDSPVIEMMYIKREVLPSSIDEIISPSDDHLKTGYSYGFRIIGNVLVVDGQTGGYSGWVTSMILTPEQIEILELGEIPDGILNI